MVLYCWYLTYNGTDFRQVKGAGRGNLRLAKWKFPGNLDALI